MKFLVIVPIFFLYFLSSNAQVKISGTVKGNTGFIQSASVTLYKKGENIIAGYSITNVTGHYKIETALSIDSFDINYSCIGYAPIKLRIANYSQVLDIFLLAQKVLLPEINVEVKIPVIKRGDTINYNAAEFSARNDRVIGDIIKRLPGIEVEPNGQIKYQGKPIRNYYIENLDLLGSKYNIANQNLPADLVDKIQILENHQPVKVYDSSVTSELAALNLVLKPNAKNRVISAGRAGAGIAPFLWDNEFLGLNFRKDFQFISGYKSNNAGKAFSYEMADLIYDDKNKNVLLEHKEDLLQLVNAGQPPFDEKKYLFNKMHFFYSNGLFVLNNKAQLRCNISYLPSVVTKTINSATLARFGGDSTLIIENQQQQLNNQKFSGELVYTLNTNKIFLKNNFAIENSDNKEQVEISGSEPGNQQLSNLMFLMKNNCNLIVAGKKNQYEVNSNILFKNLNQQLVIFPGAFKYFFNNASMYHSLTQNANEKLFAMDNSVAVKKNLFAFNQTFTAGLYYQNSIIESALYKDTGLKVQLSDSFQNDLHWEHWKPYAEVGFTVNKFFIITGKTTAAYNVLNRKNFILTGAKTDALFFINNSINIKRDLSRFFSVTLFLANETTIGSANLNTTGFILNNYRSIYKNSQALAKNKSYTSILQFNYRNPVHILFAYISGGLSVTNRNLFFENVYYNQLLSQNAIENPNKSYSWFFNWNASKFFKRSKTSLSLNGTYNTGLYQQNLQGLQSKISSRSLKVGVSIYNRLSDFVYPEFSINTLFLSNSINTVNSKQSFAPIVQSNQTVKMSLFLFKNLTLTPSVNSFYSDVNGQTKNHYLFFDFTAGFKKDKMDVELTAANLSGITNFISIISQDNFQSIQSYRLRPLNIILYVRFRL